MKTKIMKINDKNPQINKIKQCAKIIKQGGLVAFPTETVYGLGGSAFNKKSIKKIFVAKGRPQDNPLIVHIADENEIYFLAKNIPKKAEILIKKFWPGPLTVVLEKKKIVPDIITANLNTVAIRMPKNKIALELIRKSKVPIVAPSANISGKPSPTSAIHVIEDLNNKIDVIIYAKDTDIGIESTVIDFTSKIPIILRPGKITKEKIEKVIGKIKMHKPNKKSEQNKKVKSPGMKYRHYAPNAKIILFKNKKELQKLENKINREKKSYAILSIYSKAKNTKESYYAKNIIELTKNTFKKFREFDKKNIKIILFESQKEIGLGHSLMNRVKKASQNKKINKNNQIL
jgi:L-threonylcarbamoyladenylate synthase